MKTVSSIAALAAVALLGAVSSASAADLGGDCCADLEERIAELEATTARKGNRKVSLTIYGQVNQAVMFWDDATERNTYVVNNKTSTSYFGFEGSATINPEWRAGYLIEIEVAAANSDFVDQGDIGFFTTGGTVPISTFIGPVGDDGRNGLFLRHSNWWLESKRLGRVTIGQQSNATDNIAEMDLSRTSVVSLSSVETWNEGFWLRSANDGLAVSMPGIVFGARGIPVSIVGDLWRGNFDGGRGNFVRFDSPVVQGFILSASWGEDDDWAIAARYAATFNGVSVKAGIGYQDGKTIDSDSLIAITGGGNAIPDHNEIVGSMSLLHEPSGLYFTAAGGVRRWTESPYPGAELTDEKYMYFKGGLLRKWFPIGHTSVYGEYYRIWDVGLNVTDAANPLFPINNLFSEEAHAVGFGVVQHVDAAAMELYVAYRHYWANDITDIGVIAVQAGGGIPDVSDHDIRYDIVMTGARIKF
jgi:hypothetical protein